MDFDTSFKKKKKRKGKMSIEISPEAEEWN